MRELNGSRPEWLKKRLVSDENIFTMKRLLAEYGLATVCEASLCPNLNECFSRRFATYLLLGGVCMRSCGFCAVKKGAPPLPVDSGEPARISDLVRGLELKYVILTSVTRDDLEDKGVGQFIETIRLIKNKSCGARIEVLVPDFGGDEDLLRVLVEAGPDIIGHNIETVRRLYPVVRPEADYDRSVELLKSVKKMAPSRLTKSGIMVGLGERDGEILDTMADLRRAGCDILTIGQYLRPGAENLAVEAFIEPWEFDSYKEMGEHLGFLYVSSGPFVRSSYFAERAYENVVPRKRLSVLRQGSARTLKRSRPSILLEDDPELYRRVEGSVAFSG